MALLKETRSPLSTPRAKASVVSHTFGLPAHALLRLEKHNLLAASLLHLLGRRRERRCACSSPPQPQFLLIIIRFGLLLLVLRVKWETSTSDQCSTLLYYLCNCSFPPPLSPRAAHLAWTAARQQQCEPCPPRTSAASTRRRGTCLRPPARMGGSRSGMLSMGR
jgi:hypothetical protein